MMNVSLNEVTAMARKATRGAGYDWGVADEAAQAVRWLCAHGLDGCKALAGILAPRDNAALKAMTPDVAGRAWYCTSGTLCPLLAGGALSDFAYRLSGDDLVLTSVHTPVLLLPYAASAARFAECPVTLTWDGVSAVTDGQTVSIEGPDDAVMSASPCCASVCTGGQVTDPLPTATRAIPAAADWRALDDLAARTYAPATEESRRAGAGAGLSDND